MTKRSNWCEFDDKTRKYIKKRDNNKCVFCNHSGALQIAHIFLSRAHSGKGCKENGCLLCIDCHKILDNAIGKKQNDFAKEIYNKCSNYLIEKENINFNDEFIESLKFKKEDTLKNIDINLIEKQVKEFNENKLKYKLRCKNCKMLVKNKNTNSSIPSYYCKYRKVNINKSTLACKKFI